MAVQESLKQQDVHGVTFDATGFMDQIMTTVDSSRSDIGVRSDIVESLTNIQTEKSGESRINAFYRLIGLPATRSKGIGNLSRENGKAFKQLSQNETLNFFNESEIAEQSTLTLKLNQREWVLQAEITEATYLTMIDDPLPLASSVSDNPSIRRTSIFPMVVNASIPVFPLAKRTAPLFFNGDFILSGADRTRLPRTFLESVIFMRTQAVVAPSDVREELEKNINDQLAKGAGDEETTKLIEQIRNVSILESEIIRKLIQALKNSAITYNKERKNVESLKGKVKFNPTPRDTPKEKSGQSVFSDGGILEIGDIDKEINQINFNINSLNYFLQALPTDRVKMADSIGRNANDNKPSNIIGDIFVSEFTDLIGFERETLERQLGEATAKKTQLLNQFERASKNIQYFSGEISGLSIFDVMCVFLALFTVDITDLLALLNKEALERLRSNSYFSFQSDPANTATQRTTIFATNERTKKIEQQLGQQTTTVIQGLKNLEDRVKKCFELAEAFYLEADKSGENRK